MVCVLHERSFFDGKPVSVSRTKPMIFSFEKCFFTSDLPSLWGRTLKLRAT